MDRGFRRLTQRGGSDGSGLEVAVVVVVLVVVAVVEKAEMVVFYPWDRSAGLRWASLLLVGGAGAACCGAAAG